MKSICKNPALNWHGSLCITCSQYSGLSLWVGIQLSAFGDLEPWVLNMIICIAVAMATEVTSNVATATLLMPIMAELVSVLIHSGFVQQVMIAKTVA